MNIEDLEKIKINVIDSLSKNINDWAGRYSDYIQDIVNTPKALARCRKPIGLSVYTSISKRDGNSVDLRYEGQSVANVQFGKDGLKIIPNEATNRKTFKQNYLELKIPKEGFKWDSKDGKKFRSFFKNLSTDIDVRFKEHKVENHLLKAFSMPNSEKPIPHIQPVTLFRSYFQMPTIISASNEDKRYNPNSHCGIDIMARIKDRSSKPRLCIMEIKDQNKDSEPQSKVISQAFAYAVFIAYLIRANEAKGTYWWNFFMGRKTYIDNVPAHIDIEVVSVMPEIVSESDAEIDNVTINLNSLNIDLHCRTLYFDEQVYKRCGDFKFSGSFLNDIRKR
jgi:predicted transposase YbfD/YdcC